MTHSTEVLLFDAETWTLRIISASHTPRPITWKDTMKCLRLYLSIEKGSMMRRLTSVAIRLFTSSLKPRQVFSS